MDKKKVSLNRRRFLKRAAQAGAVLAIPQIIPAKAMGAGGVAPSEKITLGAIGIGHRGSYDLSCFLREPDLHCIAVCDVRGDNRGRAKNQVDAQNGNKDCVTYIDFRELLARQDIDALLIATGPNWHATAATMAAKAGKDVYCEKPSTKNIVQSLQLRDVFHRTGRVFQCGTQRRSLPNFAYAIELARTGKLGRLKTVYAHPGGLGTKMSGWFPPEPEPKREDVDWDMFLGPAAWRPYNKKLMNAFNFEKGGGLTGGGCLEWGSHCVDLCQWANNADGTSPVEYEPVGDQLHAKYANGVNLVLRNDGWMPGMGSCPVRFEGETGWVETGDNAEIAASSDSLLLRRGKKIPGYPADFHIRNFLDCVKTRALTRATATVACSSHITCHASNVALFLDRKVRFDPKKSVFIGDKEANRLRSEALREPWRI